MKIGRLLLAALLPLLLTGCMMTASVEDLYALPRLPAEYQALGGQIDAILAGGAQTISPTAGANLQSVQLEDLDGDGKEEAIAFFRGKDDEKPLKIYIFREENDAYRQAALIEGSGTSIRSIQYLDMDRDGEKEILVSWRVSTQLQALSVYSLEEMEPVLLLSTTYARCETVDLDGDERLELVVLRADESENGGCLADHYSWDGGSLVLRSGARLSVSVAELQWMQSGTLEDGETAVFVTGRVAGVEETSRAVTDILTVVEGELTNIVLNQSTGVSSQIARYLNLQPTDIDGDGITEVPMPAALPDPSGEEAWKIYWSSYTADGKSRRRVITYHNPLDNWYLLIPEKWDGHFTVEQNNTGTTEHATTFYSIRGGQIDAELLTIYTLTGDDREAQAIRGDRAILRRQSGVVYAVEYAPGYGSWRYAVETQDLVERFNAITTQWSTGEE